MNGLNLSANLEWGRSLLCSKRLLNLDTALKLDQRSDLIAAKCWVGILGESLRDPSLFARIKRHLERELEHLQIVSEKKLTLDDCSTLLAFVLGSLVFGAFAPKKVAGFAAESGKRILDLLLAKKPAEDRSSDGQQLPTA